ASTAILACLWERTRSGKGYCIDLSLMDCAVASQVNLFQAFLTNRQIGLEGHEANPPRQGNSHYQIVPYQLFPTQDGHLVLAIGSDAQWRRWAERHAPELSADPRFSTNQERVRHRDLLVPRIEAILRQKTTSDWIRLLSEQDIPHAPVQTYAELAASPWSASRPVSVTIRDHSGQPIDLVGNPFHIQSLDPARPVEDFPGSVPPERGADTDALLRDLCGYDPAEVAALREQGAIE
ncbi:MAG: CoA transferase, partial [Gemmataceae bacterium]